MCSSERLQIMTLIVSRWRTFQQYHDYRFVRALKEIDFAHVLLLAWHERAEKTFHAHLRETYNKALTAYNTMIIHVHEIANIVKFNNGRAVPTPQLWSSTVEKAEWAKITASMEMFCLAEWMRLDGKFGGKEHSVVLEKYKEELDAWWERFSDIVDEASELLGEIERVRPHGPS